MSRVLAASACPRMSTSHLLPNCKCRSGSLQPAALRAYQLAIEAAGARARRQPTFSCLSSAAACIAQAQRHRWLYSRIRYAARRSCSSNPGPRGRRCWLVQPGQQACGQFRVLQQLACRGETLPGRCLCNRCTPSCCATSAIMGCTRSNEGQVVGLQGN